MVTRFMLVLLLVLPAAGCSGHGGRVVQDELRLRMQVAEVFVFWQPAFITPPDPTPPTLPPGDKMSGAGQVQAATFPAPVVRPARFRLFNLFRRPKRRRG